MFIRCSIINSNANTWNNKNSSMKWAKKNTITITKQKKMGGEDKYTTRKARNNEGGGWREKIKLLLSEYLHRPPPIGWRNGRVLIVATDAPGREVSRAAISWGRGPRAVFENYHRNPGTEFLKCPGNRQVYYYAHQIYIVFQIRVVILIQNIRKFYLLATYYSGFVFVMMEINYEIRQIRFKPK